MNSSEKLRQILSKHIPANSLPYCLRLWEEKPFNFTISKSRKSKLGDFRYRRDRGIQTITINGDLNPYQFLLTFIHEVAHLHTFLNFGIEIAPHGQEWKQTFQKLISPLLSVQVFPRDLLIPLQRHMRAPKASSAQDLFLMKEMSKYDLQKDRSGLTPSRSQPGKSIFRFLLLQWGKSKRYCLSIKLYWRRRRLIGLGNTTILPENLRTCRRPVFHI